MTEYPSNNRERVTPDEPSEKRESLRVVSDNTKVIRAKKPVGRRMKDMFISAEPGAVRDHIIQRVLVPALRDMFADAFNESVNRMFYGDKNAPSRRTSRPTFGGGGPTNYTKFTSSRSSDTRPPHPTSRQSTTFDEVILPDRNEANDVLESMGNVIDEHGCVSVADFYEMLGERPNHVDAKYGWFDLRNARVRRVNNGYLLELPRPEPLN
jgi:hypothetical protein